MPMADKHIRRSGADYAHAFSTLLPTGIAWPRYGGTVLMRAVRGLAGYWGYVDGRAADLLETESDPRKTIELLPDWERNWGLPDPCLTPPQGLQARRAFLVMRMTMLGAQSRQFYTDVAQGLGYTVEHIREFAPFVTGISRCGMRPDYLGYPRWQLGPPENRFYWTIKITGVRLTWFRASVGRCGIDPLLDIGVPQDLECIIDRWRPAHTVVIYDYGSLPIPDPSPTISPPTRRLSFIAVMHPTVTRTG
jgi:uncharacterized protein YmfQ (DUF2313 family)